MAIPSDETRKKLAGRRILPVTQPPKQSASVRPDPTTDSFEQLLDQPRAGTRCGSCVESGRDSGDAALTTPANANWLIAMWSG